MVLGLLAGPRALVGQDQARNFADQPILVLNTGGHSAPIRGLAFSIDERWLLSAGEDKVVRVWDLSANPPTLLRTIRPPIWRGPAGAIYAMALSPLDAQGGQTLALAGYSVHGSRGAIGLYSFPGRADRGTGDPIAELAAGDPRPGVEPAGHVSTVGCLAFDPSGERLASGGSDGTVRLWDVRGRTQLAVLRDAGQAQVNALAFTPDGGQLVTGGKDGALRLWDVRARGLAAKAPPAGVQADNPGGEQINTLAVSPDGRFIVIGREDGFILRYDRTLPDLAATIASLHDPKRSNPMTGAVEAVAFGPDGRLASSVISRMSAATDRPSVSCEIAIRSMPDGAVVDRVYSAGNTPPNPLSNLSHALAFSPRGSYLAIGGGDEQGISLKDLRNPLGPISRLSGQGRSVWSVGFADVGPDAPKELAVAFSHEPPGTAPPDGFRGLVLKSRGLTTFRPDQVRGAVASYAGWSVRPVSPTHLDVFENNAWKFRVTLTDLEGRWWSHSFLPPGPGHPDATLAVACAQGLVIHRLDGVRTRFFDGHGGPVYCLAPSGDGRWLATGSGDQTIRLWSLAGCDTVAALGAEFERRGGDHVVKSIAARGFAEASGLQVGDVIDVFVIGREKVAPETFLATYAAVPPNTAIQFAVRPRAGGQPDTRPRNPSGLIVVGTTKRDRPVLSMFAGLDGEWVVWMPRGYYDTSVAGDSMFLGWHLNHYEATRPGSSDYFPIVTYEKTLRQPKSAPGNRLDRLIDTADEAVALGALPRDRPPDEVKQAPPRIAAVVGRGGAEVRGVDGKLIEPGAPLPEAIVVGPGPLVLGWRVTDPRAAGANRFEVRADGQRVAPAGAPEVDPVGGSTTIPARYDLDGGVHRLLAVARDDRGIERRVPITVEVTGPARRAPGRLRVIAVAPESVDETIPRIASGATDVRDLSRFFIRHLVNEGGTAFGSVDGDDARLVGLEATSGRIAAAFGAVAEAPLGRGDMVIVLIEAHLLDSERQARIVSADSRGVPPSPSVSADQIGTGLGSLVRAGCKVVVVLDAVQSSPRLAWQTDALEWVRQLRNEHDVITLVVSARSPLQVGTAARRRVLAEAVLESIRSGRPTRRADGIKALSLADFRAAVFEGVQRLTGRRESAGCYIPDGIDAGLPFLDPVAPPRRD